MDTNTHQYPITSASMASYPDYLLGFESISFKPQWYEWILMPSRETVTDSRNCRVKNDAVLNVLLEAYGDFPENWDGDGATALDRESFRNACSFAENLPLGLPLPEVSALPDGCVILDWSSEKGLLSVQFFPKGGYAFALNDNEGQVSGMENNTLVAPILGMIRRVMCP